MNAAEHATPREEATGWDALEALVRAGASPASSVAPDAVHANGAALAADKSAALAADKSAALAALPEYRHVWFLSLIRQGREAEAAERAALAAHCRARVLRELEALGSVAAAATAGTPGTSRPSGPQESGRGEGTTPEDQGGQGEKGPRARTSPLDDLAARQGQAARAQLLGLLARHRDRLPRAESAAFETAAVDAAPATVTELRRRLVDRLLRAGRYRRQAARLAAWKPLAPDAAPAGPYNDFRALEDVLQSTASHASGAAGGAEWVAEFFDLYETMHATRRSYGRFLPGSKG